ncbi:SDR family NAD(P)-dependent oxidoreductase [Sphingobium sp.]|uniref:SDR family NAD(P)-dependent oxidoreductase n=1 Tax=Sphingobium sp. TaxID=1912891 RepID=UPI0028BD5602|nr:SDR family NAD(P)-dependent oxidoreductase [Sphingobium sp.]
MAEEVEIRGGVAVITGAASGIGTGLARKAIALGMKLVIADVRADQLDAFAATLDGEVLALPTDVRDLKAVEALAEAAWNRFGQVDILFNNAGVMATGFSWEIEPERWQRSMSVNVDGVLNGIRAFVPRLLEAGRPARIVNTASVGGFLPAPLMAPYSVSKAAVVALTESLHFEMQMIGAPIRVSLLAPGPVKSGIFDDPFGPHVDPAARGFVETMRGMLTANGLSPDEFAQRVFEGLAAGNYWLFPQPEAIDPLFERRAASIRDRATPQLLNFSEL